MIIQCVGYFLFISYVIVVGHMLYNTFIIFFVYPLSWWSVIWYIMCRWFYECVFICSPCCLYDYTLLELISIYSKRIRQIPWLLMHSLVLSKAFDSLPQGLLIAKLSAYGVEFYSCRLLSNYLYNSHQRVKLGNIRSEWSDVTQGVPQGSILGPILFNVFITDIFFLECGCHIYNYADDNCISCSSDTIDTIRNVLTNYINVFMNWFKQNSLKANPEKFQSMVISSHICDAEHISNVCIKAGWQLMFFSGVKEFLTTKVVWLFMIHLLCQISITVPSPGCLLARSHLKQLRIFKNAPCNHIIIICWTTVKLLELRSWHCFYWQLRSINVLIISTQRI